jgi:hypothetical protein
VLTECGHQIKNEKISKSARRRHLLPRAGKKYPHTAAHADAPNYRRRSPDKHTKAHHSTASTVKIRIILIAIRQLFDMAASD